ncbi:DUF6115 domain-containing protein [Pseudalkalibacillus hwajinpoensis]|uniref:DUF2802 domain-containing protein n=1 Tax=Guptibacillus hwajinpoensis TaxID=208199 RepID=A0A4U1MJ39_9BACL|nr:hypothetical protein [Pseudalkalibacillus hwajinpoensis]TKD70565.1 hypothetical protein FBF83_08000 [Pseudalkalibacillus hwajinpoensis]
MYPFIFISIALHLVSFLCIVLLYLKQSKSSEVREEVASSMEEYIEQLEHENDRLMTQVKTFVEKRENQLDIRLRVLEQNGKPVQQPRQEPQYTQSQSQPREPLQYEQQPIPPQQTEPRSPIIIQHPSAKNERNQKAIQLYQQGFAATDIARLLNCGTGEIELIVNMHGRSLQR